MSTEQLIADIHRKVVAMEQKARAGDTFNVVEAAKYLKIEPNTLQKKSTGKNPEIPFSWGAGKKIWTRRDLDAVIQRNRIA